jgi:hypothetical protein
VRKREKLKKRELQLYKEEWAARMQGEWAGESWRRMRAGLHAGCLLPALGTSRRCWLGRTVSWQQLTRNLDSLPVRCPACPPNLLQPSRTARRAWCCGRAG